MRAHFAGDVEVAATNSVDEIEHEPLEARIDDFKKDAKNMEVVTGFIDDVLKKAEAEAMKQRYVKNGISKPPQPKEKPRQSFTIPDFKNGKVVNRARGLVVRIFDAICNCANSAAAPAQRIKLRGKRAAAAAEAATANAATNDGKEKKEDKKKDDKETRNANEQVEDLEKERTHSKN